MKLLLTLALLVLSSNAFAKNRKIAIIIGNSEYAAPFSNPVTTLNNATAVKEELAFLGYQSKDIKFLQNATLAQIKKVVSEIPSRLDASDELFFYYSGHGAQSGRVNFLIPVDGARELDTYFSITTLLDKIDNDARKIVILDSCSSPTRASTEVESSLDNFPFNTFLAVSSSPGQVASEVNNDTKADADINNKAHSTFTKTLVRQMRKKDITVSEAFDKVRAAVLMSSKQKQTPIVKSNTIETLYFRSARPEYITPPLTVDMVVGQAQFIAQSYVAHQVGEDLEKLYAMFSFENFLWNGELKSKATYEEETLKLRDKWRTRTYDRSVGKVDEDSIDSSHKTVKVYINFSFEYKRGNDVPGMKREESKGCSKNELTLKWIDGKFLITEVKEKVSRGLPAIKLCKLGKFND